jgi:hypothetical protein
MDGTPNKYKQCPEMMQAHSLCLKHLILEQATFWKKCPVSDMVSHTILLVPTVGRK